uniref:NADP-dependent oxidoreductase domain-containing protein n=1 Tax=Timspurckia oligopyrenoides TaxID=708627 RepID=A0A7S0ZKV1_9RHOD|mmetsp:Transcript_9266/g.16693  ORF Transcript_9266/g.16693 Transcript_9266/m.16693 type:complete len:393 (+) Transcript_9266:26-1204(+)
MTIPSTSFSKRPLGSSSLMVTPVCLGTMTFGVQNTKEDAFQLLDYAVKTRGINFIDTAELYPAPTAHSYWNSEQVHADWKPGKTESIVGDWLEQNQSLRESIVIATKVAGYIPSSVIPSYRMNHTTDEHSLGQKSACRLDKQSIKSACDASLNRLKTSYIDLYQLHWPDRYIPAFGDTMYELSRVRPESVPIRETVLAMQELLDEGKIKAWGLSNETTYGVCEFVKICDELNVQRPASIQNSYSLLHRSFETELAEACAPHHYNIGLLPWSVLAGGALSGKYVLNNNNKEALKNSRNVLFPSFQGRFFSERANIATRKYVDIANEIGVSPAALALAFCCSRWFVQLNGSCIIGATTLDQLKENIDACLIQLDESTIQKINSVHLEYRDPCMN